MAGSYILWTFVVLAPLWQCIVAQQGCFSTSCGLPSGSCITIPETGIVWCSHGGLLTNPGKHTANPMKNHNIQNFTNGSMNCYILMSTSKGQKYVIQSTFKYTNFDIRRKPPVFNVLIDGTLVVFRVSMAAASSKPKEVIFAARSSNLTYCLISVPYGGMPLLCTLQLRPVHKYLYIQGNMTMLSKVLPIHCGNHSFSYRLLKNAGAIRWFSALLSDLQVLDADYNNGDVHKNNLKGTTPDSSLQKSNRRLLELTYPRNLMRAPDNGTMTPSLPDNNQWMKILIGCIVGISLLVLLVVVSVTLYCLYKCQAKVPKPNANEVYTTTPPQYAIKTAPQEQLELTSVTVKAFSIMELATATNHFNQRIGEGGFGAVYHGILPNGQAIAVKVRSALSIQGIREFNAELSFLSEVQHENLVPLAGYCSEQQILVYPYMSNGSLQDRLYGEPARRKPLDWLTRLGIALGAARGLNFLHTAGARCIIHRDVKSSNILLDNSMTAKLADLGFSKYAPQDDDSLVSLEVRGTAGYLDPEYYSTQQLTVKSDVFSFGVVLLEIICGREPLNIKRPRPEWSLVEWAKPFILDANVQAIVDPVISSSYSPEAMWRVVEIAISSVESRSVFRPSMADIIRELEDALIIENNASQYMASIESIGSSIGDARMPPPMPLFSQCDTLPVFSETMASPAQR